MQRYGLSGLPVQSETYGSGEFEAVAMRMFNTRIANAKKQIADTGKSEPLINSEFIQNFLTFLNEDVIRALITRYQTEKFNAYVDAIVDDPKNAIAYKYPDVSPDVNDPVALSIPNIVKFNVVGLTKVVYVAIKRAEEVAGKLTVTVEDFSRFRVLVDDAYKAERLNIEKDIENYNSFARSRVEMVKAMYRDDVSGESAIKGYLIDAIKEQFKLGNVTDESLAEIAGTYSHLQKVLSDFVDSHQKEMLELATSDVKPDEISKRKMLELATSDVKPDEISKKIKKNSFYSADELKTIYRNKAKDVVLGLSKTSFKIIGDNRVYKFRTALEAWSKKMK